MPSGREGRGERTGATWSGGAPAVGSRGPSVGPLLEGPATRRRGDRRPTPMGHPSPPSRHQHASHGQRGRSRAAISRVDLPRDCVCNSRAQQLFSSRIMHGRPTNTECSSMSPTPQCAPRIYLIAKWIKKRPPARVRATTKKMGALRACGWGRSGASGSLGWRRATTRARWRLRRLTLEALRIHCRGERVQRICQHHELTPRQVLQRGDEAGLRCPGGAREQQASGAGQRDLDAACVRIGGNTCDQASRRQSAHND